MPKKTKDTKGEAKGPQCKGKANGQTKPNGKAEAKLPGCYGRFKGDFSANAQIRAKAPKLLAFKTYGKLAEHIRKAFACQPDENTGCRRPRRNGCQGERVGRLLADRAA